jgi:hypothetical protein
MDQRKSNIFNVNSNCLKLMVTESHRITKMGKHARKAYLQAIRTRYRQSDKLSKHTILNEFCEVCGYARKYAIRLLSRQSDAQRPSAKRPGAITPNLVCQRSTVWQTFEGGYPALAAALRNPVWRFSGKRPRGFAEGVGRHLGSVTESFTGNAP